MTTIAFKDGILAVDSAVTCEGRWEASCKKYVQFDGGVAGTTGSALILGRLVIAVDEFGYPDFDFATLHDSEALIATKAGVFCATKTGYFKMEGPFFATGSGSGIAYGAMAAGATAQQAVEIACDYDLATKGPVVALLVQN